MSGNQTMALTAHTDSQAAFFARHDVLQPKVTNPRQRATSRDLEGAGQ